MDRSLSLQNEDCLLTTRHKPNGTFLNTSHVLVQWSPNWLGISYIIHPICLFWKYEIYFKNSRIFFYEAYLHLIETTHLRSILLFSFYTFYQRSFHFWKQSWKAVSEIARSSVSKFSFISSIVVNLLTEFLILEIKKSN